MGQIVETEKKEFKWVRSIFGEGPDAAKRYHFIPEGGMNEVIKNWHAKQDAREYETASPSRITTCPRVIWLKRNKVPAINDIGWGIKQRLLLGRAFENQFAKVLDDANLLLHHWRDEPDEAQQDKFTLGEGETYLEGTPDYLLKLNQVAVSDAKTSRSDSFGYVPIEQPDIWDDWGWYKYKLQLTGYYMLCHANKDWFTEHKLPLPEVCHLFSYALDDGIVRRDLTWTPDPHDIAEVERYTKRFNAAVKATEPPECTCDEMPGAFDVKFCDYGVIERNEKTGKPNKIATHCCGDELLQEQLVKGE